MKTPLLTRSVLAALFICTTGVLTAQYGQSPRGYVQGPSVWDAPPEEFRDIQRRGFHDGVEGARHDVDNHRAPNVNNRDEFRHPHVPSSLRQDYREGFHRGYDVAMHHMLGGPQRPY